MNVMGIDAGWAAGGAAVVAIPDDLSDLGEVLQVACTRTERAAKHKRQSVTHDDAGRIRFISDQLAEIYERWKPEVVVVELPTGGAMNSGGIKGMALATATVVATLARLGAHVMLITPRANKLASTGDPEAEKSAVIAGVKRHWAWIPWIPKRTQKSNVEDQGNREAVADALSTVLAWHAAEVKRRQNGSGT